MCRDPDCSTKSFTESIELIERSLTTGAAQEICRLVGEDGCSVATTRDFGIRWACAKGCVRRHGEPLVDDPGRPDGVAAIGVDEHKRLCAKVTITPSTLRASLTSVVAGSWMSCGAQRTNVACWLSQAERCWLQALHAVALDPHRGHLNGILAYLPGAIVTVDCLHGVKLANSMVDDVRRQTQQETLGHRSHKQDSIYASRRLMTRWWERLSDCQRAKLLGALDRGDPTAK